ncbi:MAG: cation diffusion facilitator family transporter [bacterium]|nr:cation diffusion facilitator family transporter [bacterium]
MKNYILEKEGGRMTARERLLRLEKIQRVLGWTLVMNLSASLIKIALGFTTGMLMIVADGFHSLGDSLSNVVGFVGIKLAKKQPDKTYSYGYDKFESIATMLIISLISVTCYKVFEGGIERFLNPHPVKIPTLALAILVASMAINLATVLYEGGAGKKLKSGLLIADASETKADLVISGGVLASAGIMAWTSWWQVDGIVTLLIGFSILRVIWGMISPTVRVLADAQAVPPQDVIKVVFCVPGVEFCHAVRSRGPEEGFFLELHIGVRKDLTVEKAHDDICHRVKRALHDAFPGLRSANIHIEPDNAPARERASSIFKEKDPYDYS